MEIDQLAELRTQYIFTPDEGGTWGLTFDGFAAALRERNPEEFISISEPPPGDPGPGGESMSFGITLLDEDLEGSMMESPQGASVHDATAEQAAAFAEWLRERIVPAGTRITYNTAWGMESDRPDADVAEADADALTTQFLAHLEQTL